MFFTPERLANDYNSNNYLTDQNVLQLDRERRLRLEGDRERRQLTLNNVQAWCEVPSGAVAKSPTGNNNNPILLPNFDENTPPPKTHKNKKPIRFHEKRSKSLAKLAAGRHNLPYLLDPDGTKAPSYPRRRRQPQPEAGVSLVELMRSRKVFAKLQSSKPTAYYVDEALGTVCKALNFDDC